MTKGHILETDNNYASTQLTTVIQDPHNNSPSLPKLSLKAHNSKKSKGISSIFPKISSNGKNNYQTPTKNFRPVLEELTSTPKFLDILEKPINETLALNSAQKKQNLAHKEELKSLEKHCVKVGVTPSAKSSYKTPTACQTEGKDSLESKDTKTDFWNNKYMGQRSPDNSFEKDPAIQQRIEAELLEKSLWANLAPKRETWTPESEDEFETLFEKELPLSKEPSKPKIISLPQPLSEDLSDTTVLPLQSTNLPSLDDSLSTGFYQPVDFASLVLEAQSLAKKAKKPKTLNIVFNQLLSERSDSESTETANWCSSVPFSSSLLKVTSFDFRKKLDMFNAE